MTEVKKLTDSIGYKDTITGRSQKKPLRTKIIGGYDAYKDSMGVTRFGETVFETENMIVLGGSQYTLEKLFGVRSALTVDFIEDIYANHGFAPSQIVETESYLPNATVCLFGVGIGGADESITNVHDVKYYERTLGEPGKEWIPFRQTAGELTDDEKSKYYFKRNVNGTAGENYTEFYLKKFESDPDIKVLWANGNGGEDGSEVQSNVHETPDTDTTPIETFIELTLKINKKDVREFFTNSDNIEQSRINSIGLFSAVYDSAVGDYRKVKLFSKLNINNEMLTMSKDLTIVYRIYTS